MFRVFFASVALAALITAQSSAALVLTKFEAAVPQVYANGGGGGFGGTLGSGSISMDVVGTDLVIAFTPGNALNDIVGLYLDTRSGGYLDAQMSDTSDGGRTVVSELTLTKDDTYPAGIVPDFGVAIGSFGSVLFELQPTPNPLTFQVFNAAPTISIPLALLGSPGHVDFFAGYASGGGYNSNESLPFSIPLNSNGNPGFGDGQFGGLNTGGTYENFNRFVITSAIPEPTTAFVWGLVLVTAGLVAQRMRP
jgi:hypothetical protein